MTSIRAAGYTSHGKPGTAGVCAREGGRVCVPARARASLVTEVARETCPCKSARGPQRAGRPAATRSDP